MTQKTTSQCLNVFIAAVIVGLALLNTGYIGSSTQPVEAGWLEGCPTVPCFNFGWCVGCPGPSVGTCGGWGAGCSGGWAKCTGGLAPGNPVGVAGTPCTCATGC